MGAESCARAGTHGHDCVFQNEGLRLQVMRWFL
jgi:hypothetical protein